MSPYKKVLMDFWNDLEYWWFITAVIALTIALAAVNKYIIHIPGYPQW